MRADGRHLDPHFHQDEWLFRRVPTTIWDDPADELEVDAVELPDMSVGRSKHGHPEWTRFDVINNRHFEDWGIVGFQVGEIPPELWKEGVLHFEFLPHHAPLEKDYPHSEVRAFESGTHIDLEGNLPEDIHLKFRERLLRKTKTLIRPYQRVNIRQRPPASHHLEPFTVPT
jgi:hypothetical protein